MGPHFGCPGSLLGPYFINCWVPIGFPFLCLQVPICFRNSAGYMSGSHLNSPGLMRENMERAPRQLPGRLHFQKAAAKWERFWDQFAKWETFWDQVAQWETFWEPICTMENVLETNFKKPMHLRSTGWQYPALRYSACPGVCSECRNMVKIRGEEKA